ncbi:MAG TPA: BatD family protein [Chitinophagales bacterium]|nr:BatD family protein [Chitinophagales bacterium]
MTTRVSTPATYNRIFKGTLLLMLVFAMYTVASAQARFSASAPKSVPVNSNFQLSYTIENGNGTNLKLPSLNDFQLMGGPNTSTSMQWVNGNVTQSVTYSYVLRPKNQGTFKLGKASITVSGVTMESNELTIQVTAPVAQQQQQRQRNPFDPFDDPFFRGEEEEQPQTSNAEIEKQLKDEVFMKLVVSKGSVYKGEMLTATYKLYFRQNLTGFNVTKAPSFDGYWSQEVELDPKRRPATEVVNGKQYNTVEIMKYNLYPQRAGALPVAGCEVNTVAQVQMRSRSRNLFDDFFDLGRMRQVPLDLKATPITVSVKELPDNGKPADFSGAVGSYKFDATLSGKDAKTDEPITYTLKISGTGNLKFVDAPALKFPPEFEVYDPKIKENISNGAAGMSGTKQYDYLIIPRQPGDYTIEEKTFSWFDPAAGKYFTTQSPEFTVKVTGEASKNPNTAAIAAGGDKEDVAALGQDIRYIKTATPELSKGNRFFGSAGFIAMYSMPFLLLAGMIFAKRRNDTMAADVIGTKRRRALKLAKKRLSVAEKHLAKSDKKNFYDEVSRATWGYLGDKLNIDMAELSKDNVEEKLLAKNAKPETIAKLKALLGTCELALYAPVGEGGEMKQNYETAMNLMADLEDEVK